jgi:hypothetical protein
MSDDGKVINLSRRRQITHATDPVGTLQQALACARVNKVTSVAIAMIDDDYEEFYLISDGAAAPALLGALDIVKDVILDELRREDGDDAG